MSKKGNIEKLEFKMPKSPFVEYLENLANKEDWGTLAALRRGLQYELGTCIEMYPFVIPWLKYAKGKWEKKMYYLIASLFAYHPDSTQEGNMGDVFRKISQSSKNRDNKSLEQRFATLLRSDPEDLPFHLRQAISLAKSERVSINWHELLFDLKRWPYESSYPPYEKWAQSFWKRDIPTNENEENEEE